jgi:hypothetical protein
MYVSYVFLFSRSSFQVNNFQFTAWSKGYAQKDILKIPFLLFQSFFYDLHLNPTLTAMH